MKIVDGQSMIAISSDFELT